MTSVDIRFLRLAVLYILAGMSLGLWMGVSGDHGMYPAHAHMNLVGWVSLAIYGLVYRAYPAAARSRLVPWHFWLANIGAATLAIGVGLITTGHHHLAPIAGVGGAISLLGAVVFCAILFGRSAGAEQL